MLGDYIKENPEFKVDAQKDISLIKSSKLGDHEAEIEKIKNIFISILRDIKKTIDDTAALRKTADTDFLQQTLAALQEAKPQTTEEVAEIVANMVRQTTMLDANQVESFKQLAIQVLKNQDEQKR
jgi:hypothetical protein